MSSSFHTSRESPVLPGKHNEDYQDYSKLLCAFKLCSGPELLSVPGAYFPALTTEKHTILALLFPVTILTFQFTKHSGSCVFDLLSIIAAIEYL